MVIPGSVSVSFRRLSAGQVVKLCENAGLQAIEWGGDIHVPAGDLKCAREVSRMSRDAGMEITAYGSYFRLGQEEEAFRRNLDTAATLGAPVMRIWAGSKNAEDYPADERSALIDQFRKLCDCAVQQNILIAPEFHPGTITNSISSVCQLMQEMPDLRLYWQPRWDWEESKRLEALDRIGNRLMYMHVFTWRIEDGKEIRLPLADGEQMWKKVFARPFERQHAMMEFVADDLPENLLRDAAVLKRWISERGEDAECEKEKKHKASGIL